MRRPRLPHLQVLLLVLFYSFSYGGPSAGFFLPDSVAELSVRFRSIKDLIVLPVTINGTIRVNLILDTGCRNLVLFGKKFNKLFNTENSRDVQFSGLGEGGPVTGRLSIDNAVDIEGVIGQRVPVVLVEDKNIFATFPGIDGVIGYDIFTRFEIEINSRTHLITFRPALSVSPRGGYAHVPLEIVDSKPVMKSIISFSRDDHASCDLMIDTGSSLGILFKTKNLDRYTYLAAERLLGKGLNGALRGIRTLLKKMDINGFEMKGVPVGIIQSIGEDHASIGMNVLKDYIVILNYCKSYASFKRHS